MVLGCVNLGCCLTGYPAPAGLTLRGSGVHQLWVFQDNLTGTAEDAGDNLRLELWVIAILRQVDEASQFWAVLRNVLQDGCVHCCAFFVHASGCQGGCDCGGGVLHGVCLSVLFFPSTYNYT